MGGSALKILAKFILFKLNFAFAIDVLELPPQQVAEDEVPAGSADDGEGEDGDEGGPAMEERPVSELNAELKDQAREDLPPTEKEKLAAKDAAAKQREEDFAGLHALLS